MNPEDMKRRTHAFALRVIRLAEGLPNTPTAKVIKNQMLRCGSSVGAKYRAGMQGQIKAGFRFKDGDGGRRSRRKYLLDGIVN
jgi:four helix bundle protein